MIILRAMANRSRSVFSSDHDHKIAAYINPCTVQVQSCRNRMASVDIPVNSQPSVTNNCLAWVKELFFRPWS